MTYTFWPESMQVLRMQLFVHWLRRAAASRGHMNRELRSVMKWLSKCTGGREEVFG